MKIFELLIETTQDDRAIVAIASKITSHVKDNLEEFELASSALPINDLIDFDTIDPVIEKLLLTKIEFGHTGSINIGGIYKHPTKTIKINSELLDMESWDRIESNIVHELRHALDDIKSGGNLYKGEYRPAYRSARPSADTNSSPSEINARLLQAQRLMMNRINQLPATPTPTELNKIIFDCLAKFNIVDYFPTGTADPAFKRIVNRMYQIAQS